MSKNQYSFIELVDRYIREKPLSPATVKNYRSVVSRFVDDTGIKYLDQISFEPLLDWRLSVIERSSDITWNNYLRHMRALWKFAVDKQFVADVDHFRELNWGKYKTNKIKTITTKQLKCIIAILSDPDCGLEPCWFWQTVIRFMYFTGIRRKQLVTLNWADIDFTNNLVHLSAEGEKTDIARPLPLQDNLILSLKKYRQILLKNYSGAYKPEAQLFNVTLLNTKYRNRRMSEEQVSGFFKRLSKRAGFNVSAHMLRHTMATEIAKTGRVKTLQQILGHTDIRTTLDFYVHPDLNELQNLLNGLSDI